MKLPLNEDDSTTLNLTPMIDIVFLLLIFFLVATTFQQEEKDQSINLSQVFKVLPDPMGMSSSQITVNINKAGDFIVMDKVLSNKELEFLLKEEGRVNPHKKVDIRADGEVIHQKVCEVISYCQAADLEYTNKVIKRKF